MKSNRILVTFTALVLGAFFSIKGLVLAEKFLVPLTFAVVIALICVPLARKLENWGFSKGLAAFTCVVSCVLAYLAFFAVIAIQVGNLSEKWPEMQKQLIPKIENAIQKLETDTGLKVQDQMPEWLASSDSSNQAKSEKQAQSGANDEATAQSGSENKTENNQTQTSEDSQQKEGNGSVSEGVKKQLGQLAVNIFGFMGSSLLLFVYLFFLLYFRSKVKLSILRFFAKTERKQVKEVLEKSSQLALNFLIGRLLLVVFLAVIYTAGMLIAGVENAILIAVIAAMLNLIPYVGSIIGYFLALSMGLFGGAEMSALIVISLTFAIAQFVDNNILEPFVVGDKVHVNPLATIILVVLGGSIWGVAGMVLSIPIAGILKIIFDTNNELEPLGYMLGTEDSSDEEQGFISKWGEKLRGLFKKK